MHGVYEWLVTNHTTHTLDALLRLCPSLVLQKYIAVTSCDSGPLCLNDEQKAEGWERRKDIAYSPKVTSVDALPRDQFDEWYVFDTPHDLGQLVPSGRNIFETPLVKGQVQVFVNFLGFAFHCPELEALTTLFWEQFAWIHPETYIADGDYLTIVSKDKDVFALARQALINLCRSQTDAALRYPLGGGFCVPRCNPARGRIGRRHGKRCNPQANIQLAL